MGTVTAKVKVCARIAAATVDPVLPAVIAAVVAAAATADRAAIADHVVAPAALAPARVEISPLLRAGL